MANVVIVGAGPAGSTVAYQLAKAGYTVDVFEEHPSIGKPIQCTGIVTKALFTFVEKDDSYIVNTLDGVNVHAPSGNVTKIPLREWVICREKFDNFLAEKAKRAGVTYHLRHKFVDVKGNIATFKHGDREIKKPFDILVGADGSFTAVGRAAGLVSGRHYYIGSQATVKANVDPKWFETFFGSDAAPGFFAWAVPENEKFTRVGVATEKNVHAYFDILRKKFDGEIVDRQAGPIPIYDGAKRVQNDNIYLVGDAAGLCKNTTGGGIITGIWSANILADAIINKKNYSKQLKPLRRELWMHQKLRNMLDRFSDKDYERLVRWMNTAKVKKVLFEHPREYPTRFMWKLALAQPKLFAFARHALA